MEILRPEQPEVQNTPMAKEDNAGIPKEFLDSGITFKNAEFADYLGLRDELFNENVMQKIDFIASKLENADHLQDVDMRLGHDGSIPRIDKIYSYLKLLDQSDIMQERKNLIDKQIQRYEQSS